MSNPTQHAKKAHSRRSYLKGAGVALSALAFTGTASAAGSDYDQVVDLVEEGADPTGETSITPLLYEHADDDTLIRLPEGRYRMNSQFRFTGYENFGIVGDDATIFPGSMEEADYNSVQEGEFSGPARLFRLGVIYDPGKNLRFEGLDFDYRAENSGLRAIEAYVSDGLQVTDVNVHGRHDTGVFGPALFCITDSDGYGEVTRFRAPDGGEFSEYTIGDIWVGPTGMLVGPNHAGHLAVVDCELGDFPDNGLYASSPHGRVVVDGGVYRNSNVASIRMFGDYSYVKNARIVIDKPLASEHTQRGVRFDDGKHMWVYNTVFELPEPSGAAVTVNENVEWARVQDCSISVGKKSASAIELSEKAGEFSVLNTDIEFDGAGNAIDVAGTNTADDVPAWLYRVTITGDASGRVGRNAIRCTRRGSTFREMNITQTGPDYRRAISFQADDCTLLWSDLTASHIPIVNIGDGTTIQGSSARSVDGYSALKLYDGYEDVTVKNCTLYNGYSDFGTENLTVEDVSTPES